MTNEELFFDALKAHRESSNIEISEICDFTKIHPRYIEAIESGEFNILPVVYMRLFLRAYAEFIGADSGKALEDFELYTTGKVQKKEDIETTSNSSTYTNNANINLISNGQIAPKQIIMGSTIIIGLFIILYWASQITNQQKDLIKIDDQKDNAPLISRDSTKSIKTSDNNLLENEIEKKNPIINNIKILNNNSTNNSPNSLTIDKNIPLNQNDFLLENRIEQTTHIINLNKPYSISISTINETKLNISKSNNSQITSLINSIVPKNSQYKFNFESTINFEFWNNSDIIVKLNNISLDKFLSKNNLSIRGSYEADKSQLYIGFYNKLTQ